MGYCIFALCKRSYVKMMKLGAGSVIWVTIRIGK